MENFIPSSWGKQGETPVIGLLELSVGEGKSIKCCIASGVLSWGEANYVPIVIQEVHPGERESINLQQSSWRFLPSLSGVFPSLIIQREEVRCWEWWDLINFDFVPHFSRCFNKMMSFNNNSSDSSLFFWFFLHLGVQALIMKHSLFLCK